MKTNDVWIRRFLEAAEHRSTFSKDPSTKVGAVIVAPDGKNDIAYGYNGYPKRLPDIRLDDREYKYPRTIHAELNAILNTNKVLDGCIMFTTLAPCSGCAAAIAQKGFSTVYHIQEMFESNDRWIKSHKEALDIFLSVEPNIRCIGVRQDGSFVEELEQLHLIDERLKNENA